MRKKNKPVEDHRFQDLDAKYIINTEYDNITSCESYGCKDERICRCSKIENVRLTLPNDITVKIMEEYLKNNSNLFDRYCVERILAHYKLYNVDAWEPNIRGGYYGEELDSVILDKAISEKCDLACLQVLSLKTNTEKIEFILELEYGYLLEEVKKQEWEIIVIEKEKLIFGQIDHYKKIDAEIVKKYEDYSLPRGICLKKGKNQYRLIDGYHRCKAEKSNMITIIANK